MIDPDAFRSILGRFTTGVTVVTIRDGGGTDHGMTVSAFASVSLEPPLVLACIGRDSDMHPVLGDAKHFGISILTAEQEALSRRFSDPLLDRFAGVGYHRAASGVALLDDALATLDCTIAARHEAGDHTIVIGQVDDGAMTNAPPLVYFRSGYTQLER